MTTTKTHEWSKSDERKQWECLGCGATVSFTHAHSEPDSETVLMAQQPGTGDHALHRVRSLTCPGS